MIYIFPRIVLKIFLASVGFDLSMKRIPRSKRLELIERYGFLPVTRSMADDALTHFTVEGEEGFLGYVEKGGSYLVPGEPICAEENGKNFFSSFLRHSVEQKRKVCFFGCSERMGAAAKSAGYSVIKFGQEAILNVPKFSLGGNAMENVRRGFNHANNVGMSVSEYIPGNERDAELENELLSISKEWLNSKKTPELGFLLGRMELHRLEGRRIFVARTKMRIEGFIILNPVLKRRGWYTDIMRRRTDAPNGVNEKLLVEIIGTLREEGVENIFLGMVPFVGLNPDMPEHRKVTKLMNSLKGRIDFLYPIESVYFFKDKFQPCWHDVYIFVYPKVTTNMIYGIIRAFLQGGLGYLIKHRIKGLKRLRYPELPSPQPKNKDILR